MRPFLYDRASTSEAAAKALLFGQAAQPAPVQGRYPAEFIAGGTTLLDLMKLDVMQPTRVVDVNDLGAAHGGITVDDKGLRLGALARMAAVADHAEVNRLYPVVAQTLTLAASAQLRNMASVGGNVLQRTRCNYFRDTSWSACNKRNPGSGCAALDGQNRQHAVLGASKDCIAAYPGDFAQSLAALDATVEIAGPEGVRTIAFTDLHRRPGSTPNVETVLKPGELITGFTIAAAPWTRRSLYMKIRDRQSYAFALASAAVALDMDGKTVRQARIALGGVPSVPWRAREAEASLAGKVLDATSAEAAARVAFAGAVPHEHNAYKVALGRKTVTRALLQAASLEV